MKITSFTVIPEAPPKLKALIDLAYNLYFSWNRDVVDLFKRIDRELWEKAGRNPVKMLGILDQSRFMRLAKENAFLLEMSSAHSLFSKYMTSKTWYSEEWGEAASPQIAYFSAEYGLHECLPIYSGGLGVLSGDHIKSASDLGIPLVGVGLLYRQGFFQQHIDIDGHQQESYPENDWHTMPVKLELDASGNPHLGMISMTGEKVYFHIWKVTVGRIKIFLLDTNIRENDAKNRDITKTLYDADRKTRMRQEMILGMGGFRALSMLGIEPAVYHLNEGHSAFMLLERLKALKCEKRLTLEEAIEVVRASSVFTTHTPVGAGNETFGTDLMKAHFSELAEELGIDWNVFLKWGSTPIAPPKEKHEFSLTLLALRLCSAANGVSKLHGQVSRKLWQNLYPHALEREVPIGHVVNGVHAPTWLNPYITNLFLKYGGASYSNELASFRYWDLVSEIKDEELWEIRQESRAHLIEFVREKLKIQYRRYGSSRGELLRIDEMLDPNSLTIGFSRRFTEYKRGHLLFSDKNRLKALIRSKERPVQIILSGKAHPADLHGKEIIRTIHEFARDKELESRIVFIENYDLEIARHLVQGVDVWLNTPRRLMEASGTSGMKCAMNGGLNFSILDGWWDEAYNPEVGWPIGQGELIESPKEQDAIEGGLMFSVLEKEIIPLFYNRNEEQMPVHWIQMIRQSVAELGHQYNSHRMVEEYLKKYYMPAKEAYLQFSKNNFENARILNKWKQHVQSCWDKIFISHLEPLAKDVVKLGDSLAVGAWVKLHQLDEKDVLVECYHGPLGNTHQIEQGVCVPMTASGKEAELTLFKAEISCVKGGHYGYSVRISPRHELLTSRINLDLVKWI